MAPPIKLSSPATREFWEIPVLVEDEHLLALDKPPGVLVSPDILDATRPSLMSLIHSGIAAQKPWAASRGLNYLANSHRLDFETSGVLLLAKNKAALVSLANQFSTDTPAKIQFALLHGNPPQEVEAQVKIAPHPVKPGAQHTDSKRGKKCRTRFTVVESFTNCALVRCEIIGDRPHQVRVHAEHLGWPVVGDALYGGKNLWLSRLKKDFRLKPGREERPLIAAAAVHSAELRIAHPTTGAEVVIAAPMPKYLLVALKYLRLYGRE